MDAAPDRRVYRRGEASGLYAFFHLIAFRGLRRGEGVGQDWVNVDLDAQAITIAKEIVVNGWVPFEDDPKTDGSAATIGLDSVNVAVLRAHRMRQLQGLGVPSAGSGRYPGYGHDRASSPQVKGPFLLAPCWPERTGTERRGAVLGVMADGGHPQRAADQLHGGVRYGATQPGSIRIGVTGDS
ncbi:hypothetical protein [Streptomyces sp. NPDC057072]|uniref:hypothetical protein n=1 Tax=unclassified Streptomyces TaxID=2593676 RepID=UPI003645B506